jgi:DNA-binding transcriptional MerR regulator
MSDEDRKYELSRWLDWIDSQDVLIKMHIYQRTLQTWRTNGLLPFSNINGKFYYKKSDILRLLESNYSEIRKDKEKDRKDEEGANE